MHYITWLPEVAEAGDYFLSFIDAPASTPINDLMLACHKEEDLDLAPYDLCSIIYVSPSAHNSETQVIY